MSNPHKPSSDPKKLFAEQQKLQAAASRETKRPSDSVPIVPGQFANLPAKFGRYQVEKLLGRGAMGAVYLARDTQLDRPVALKIPKVTASGSKRLLLRLETEAKAAAKLDHPSLCKVHDAGEIEGQCFIAMQYIEGETLKSQLEAKGKSVEEAVSLVLQLAEGLSEAHELGIIHRDLKPENIMINRRGTPVIMDFGLAKLSTVPKNALATQAGTILGSPAYMSPEQASGNVEEIDQRSDIYALGIILFELLTGQLPFTGSAMQILGQKSLKDPPSPLSLKPDLHPQLAAICHKMIAKTNAERYQTLTAVIADLRALDLVVPPTIELPPPLFDLQIRDEPPVSRRPSSGGRLTLPPRQAIVGGLAAGFILLLLLGVTLWLQIGDALVKVEIHADDVTVTFQDKTLKLADGPREYHVTPGAHTLHIKSGNVEFDTAKFTLKKGPNPAITVELVKSEIVSKLGTQEFDRHRFSTPNALPNSQSDWDPATVRELATLTGHTATVECVVFSRDGNRLASASGDKSVKVWDATSGQKLLTLKGHTHYVYGVAFSPDGQRLASASWDQTVRVWNASTGQELLTLLGHTRYVTSVAFNRNGDRLASSSGDKTVKVWDAISGQDLLTLTGHTQEVTSVAFSPDGQRLATASVDQTVKLWNATTGQVLHTLTGHTGRVNRVAFSAVGNRLASASQGARSSKPGELKVWDVTSGREMLNLKGHTKSVNSVEFSPDGNWLASASEDSKVKVWDVTSGQQQLTLNRHTKGVQSVAFRSDGTQLASGSKDQTVKLWGVSAPSPPVLPLKKNDYDAIATGNWVKVTDLADLIKGKSKARIVDGAIEMENAADNLVQVPKFQARDAIIRVKMKRLADTHVLYLSLRSPDGTQTCYAYVNEKGDVGIHDSNDRNDLIHHNRLAPTDGEFELAFSAVGNQLRCYINGKLVAEAVTPHPAGSGFGGFANWRGTAQFKDIEFMSLDAAPPPPGGIDVLSLIDPQRDSVNGTWRREGNALICPQVILTGLKLPVKLTDEYELEFDVKRLSGTMHFVVGVVCGGFPTLVVLDNDPLQISTFDQVWGAGYRDPNLAQWHGDFLVKDKRHTVRIVVRRTRIEVFRDGVKVIDWEGDPKNLSLFEPWKKIASEKDLSLGNDGSEFAFSRIHFWPAARTPDPSLGVPPIAVGPFDAVTARKHRKVWADYLGLPEEFTNSIGMKFSLIPPTECDLGGGKADEPKLANDRNHRHRVRMTKPIYIGQHEVTQDQFRHVMGWNRSTYALDQGGSGRHPAETMKYGEAIAFATSLSELAPEKTGLRRYRLPADHEWEIAARAGVKTDFPWGEEATSKDANLQFDIGPRRQTVPVGSYPPNAWNLYDVVGNVREWCWDSAYRASINSFAIDPIGPAAIEHISVRGGDYASHFQTHPLSDRASWRGPGGVFEPSFGFRVCMTIPVDSQDRARMNAEIRKLQVDSPKLDVNLAEKSTSAVRHHSAFPIPQKMFHGSAERVHSIWDLQTKLCWQKPQQLLETIPGDWRAFAITADGKRIVTGNGAGDIWVWDIQNCTLLSKLPPIDERVGVIVCSPLDSNVAYAAGFESGQVYQLTLREKKVRPIHQMPARKEGLAELDSLAISSDGTRLAIASPHHALRLISLATGELVGELPGRSPLTFAPNDADALYSVKSNAPELIIRWDLKQNKPTKEFQADTKSAVSSLSVSRDGMRLAAGFGGIGGDPAAKCDVVAMWNSSTGSLERTLDFQVNDGGIDVVFLPDGKSLWGSGRGKPGVSQVRAKHWHAESGAIIEELANHAAVRPNPVDPSFVSWQTAAYTRVRLGRSRLSPLACPDGKLLARSRQWMSLVPDHLYVPIPECWSVADRVVHVHGPETGTPGVALPLDVSARNFIVHARVRIFTDHSLGFTLREKGTSYIRVWHMQRNEFGAYQSDNGKVTTLKTFKHSRSFDDFVDLAVVLVDGHMRCYADGELFADIAKGVLIETGGVSLSTNGTRSKTGANKDVEAYILDAQPNVTIESAEKILLERIVQRGKLP